MKEILEILKEAGSEIVPFRWEDDAFYLLDQRKLPWKETWLLCKTWEDTFSGIKDMAVRGAPAIGITAAFGMVLGAREVEKKGEDAFSELLSIAKSLKEARPTAVNLKWAVDRVLGALKGVFAEGLYERALKEALSIWKEDCRANILMGRYGGKLLPQEGGVLTHCNAGALATGGYGTALGVIRGGISLGKKIKVFSDETRPWLQGSRLTCWELLRDGISVTLNVDSASGLLMKRGLIQAAVVGADRIASNGDVANKIGTYNVAVLCKENGIPFYVAAPSSTFDKDASSGDEIPIEERDEREVLYFSEKNMAPQGVKAYNPVFDITPSRLITAIITEKGVLEPPYEKAISSKIFGTSH